MAPRKSKVCGHSDFVGSCLDCKQKKAKKAVEDATKLFWADLENEVNFMKSFPILDDSAREKAEKDRKTLNKKMRASQRAYKGPLLFSDTARQAEKNRKKKLRRDFNKADARWSKVKREANIIYFGWSNSKLEKMSQEAKWDILNQDLAQIELKDSIAVAEGNIEKFCENRRTGNGRMGNGSDKSISTQGIL